MFGFFALFLAALWLATAVGVATFLTKKVGRPWTRAAITVLLSLLIIPLPLVDEIVARYQFQELCTQNSGFHVDRAKAVGRTIYLARLPDEEVKGTWVRVVRQPTKFIDTTTGEPVIGYDRFVAAGGRLAQSLGIEGRVPMLFTGVCDPGYQHNVDRVIKDLHITLVRKP